MKQQWQRILSLILVLTLLFSMAGCASKSETSGQQENSASGQPEETASPEVQPTEGNKMQSSAGEKAPSAALPVAEDRESLEQIVDLLQSVAPGNASNLSSEDISQMDDAHLGQLIEDMLEEQEQAQAPVTNPELTPDTSVDTPAIDTGAQEENYDENGAMELPFDQLYPEVVEQEQVEFDDETLLLKIANSHGAVITEGMAAAGVAALEAIVPMPESTWYEAKLLLGTDIDTAVEALRALSEIQMVDYNYVVQTSAMADYEALPEDWSGNAQVSEQWYLNYCGIPSGEAEMTTPGGSSSVIVAVIDTGVDYDHQDLAGNIWTNSAEIPDNGIDDDNNGYTDDYYGVNIVAGKGNGDDDNGHGTHVAGIIAAENNNLGTVGIAYNVKIMPIKAAMASGYLNQSDIAKAILYAYEHGAEVINMSFGGTACSIAVQDALSVAYTRCVLVASAGNDAMPNENRRKTLPTYPAALTYVLGVMSVNQSGVESAFSNWDGLAYSAAEYEVYAPGEGILSTIPGDRYASWSGTSMASPVVSAMAALLRSEYTDRDTYPTKFIYGQLSATSEDEAYCCSPNLHQLHNLPSIVNLYSALTTLPTPDVGLQDFTLFDAEGIALDTAAVNNGDGTIDAGETIALGLTLRNRWGMSKDTMVTLDTLSDAGMADPYITIHNPTVNYGSVGTYSTGDCGKVYTDDVFTGWENPFYITIAEDCPNDYIFNLNVTISCGNALDEADTSTYTQMSTLTLEVRNGMILPQIIEEDMTLTKENLYIIPDSTVIQAGVTVTVEPGTHIQFWSNEANDSYAEDAIAYLIVKGNLLVEGTAEDKVYIYPSDLMDTFGVEMGTDDGGYISLMHADVTNLLCANNNASQTYNAIDYAEGCIFRQNYINNFSYRYVSGGTVITANPSAANILARFDTAKQCVFYKVGFAWDTPELLGKLDGCLFVDSALNISEATLTNCVLQGNQLVDYTSSGLDYSTMQFTNVQDSTFTYDAENLTVFYREETGSTYIRGHGHLAPDSGYSDMMSYDAFAASLAGLGGGYLIVEDQAELDWLYDQEVLGYNYCYFAGLARDPKTRQLLWSDGSLVGDFLPIENEVVSPSVYQLSTDGTILGRNGYNGNGVFEIPGYVLPEDISFRIYEVTLDLEANYQLAPISAPAALDLDYFTYESSDKSILTVSDTGLVTPVAPGTANVTVWSLDRAICNYVSFTVTEEAVALESLTSGTESTDLAVGGLVNMDLIFAPANTTRTNASFRSADPAIATVNAIGQVTGISSGTTVITAQCEGLTAQMEVTVYQAATSVDILQIAMAAGYMDGTIALPELVCSDDAETDLIWESTDTAVAQIAEGAIQINAPGTTTISVTDRRSGLRDVCQLIVQDTEALVGIKDIAALGYNHVVLLENGDLYCWNNSMPTPTHILSDVAMVELAINNNSRFMVLTGEGLVQTYSMSSDPTLVSSVDTFQDAQIVDLGYCYAASDNEKSYVVLSDGRCFAWGTSSENILGTGNTTEETPALVNLENVAEVTTFSQMTMLRTTDGDLYLIGDGQGSAPLYLASGVRDLSEDTWSFWMEDGSLGMLNNSVPYYTSAPELADMDMVANQGNNYDGLALKDGRVYQFYYGFENIYLTPVAGITNAIDIDVWNNSLYVATADGLVYGFGSYIAYSNSLGGAAFESQSSPIMIPLGSISGEVSLTGTNLAEENVLTEDTLVLTFNKDLIAYAASLYADGEQTTFTYKASGNDLLVSRTSGFAEGVAYELHISAGSLKGFAGLTNSTEIVVSFTFTATEDENADAPVIHYTVVDETVERYYTLDSILEQITAYEEQEQCNITFNNNVILNRIHTTDDVSTWLRITGSSSGSGNEVPLGQNWWDTTNETLIGLQIVDYTDYPTHSRLMYAPCLTEAPENTFPFITGVTILNRNGEEVTTVSNEEITLRVTFNRDMETSIPLGAKFGSTYPYGDYEIEGSYVDARTWEGKYTLSTLIENGAQYFTFSNGCAATEDLVFLTDQARYGFTIDTTAAQALIMQGSATDTGIQLSWTQDDFDTLMGYNVYRSTSEDGYYQRLNSSVIPAETREFFDVTVEPGVVYYYNFTVVQTDLTESTPSGKISIMSKDTMSPDIYHTPVYSAYTGSNLIISATVTDNLNVTTVHVYYRTIGETTWKTAVMNKLNDKYSAIISADQLTTDGLEYYIEATDGINVTYKGSPEVPYQITIQEAINASSMGDVNGDGRISNLDALMLLQAINDLLNLTSEQFARADLNGDGTLTAAEALRILHYVSGTVGDLVMP